VSGKALEKNSPQEQAGRLPVRMRVSAHSKTPYNLVSFFFTVFSYQDIDQGVLRQRALEEE
jgi:hypothetical protein